MSFFSFKNMFKRAKKLIKSGAILTTKQVQWQHKTLKKVIGNKYGRIVVAAVASYFAGPAGGQAVMAYGQTLDAKKAGQLQGGDSGNLALASAFVNGVAAYYGGGGGTSGVADGIEISQEDTGSQDYGMDARNSIGNMIDSTTTDQTSTQPGFWQSVGDWANENPELVKIGSQFVQSALTPSKAEEQLELEEGRREARFNTPLSQTPPQPVGSQFGQGLLSQTGVPNLAPQTPLIQAQ